MDKIKSVEEGIRHLLTLRGREIPEFSIDYAKNGEYTDYLNWNGKHIPMLYTRFNGVIRGLSNYGNKGDNSALNVYSYTGSEISLNQLIYNEIEIAEFILHSETEEVTAFVNGDTVNLIAKMIDGTCANLALGTTMAKNSFNQCEHRLITAHGMADDRVVDMKTIRHDIYVFGNESVNPDVYDDDEYYLYGLNPEETQKVITIHGIFTGRVNADDFEEIDVRHKKFVRAVHISSDECRTVKLSEVSE